MAKNTKRNFVRYLINGELADQNDVVNEETLSDFIKEGYAPKLSKAFIDYLSAKNDRVENETLSIHIITRHNSRLFPERLSCQYILAQGNLSALEQGDRPFYGRNIYVHINALDIGLLKSPELEEYLRSLHEEEEGIVMVVNANYMGDAQMCLEYFNFVREHCPFRAIFVCGLNIKTLYRREWDYEEPNLVIKQPEFIRPEEFCDRSIEVKYDEEGEMLHVEVYDVSEDQYTLDKSFYYPIEDLVI